MRPNKNTFSQKAAALEQSKAYQRENNQNKTISNDRLISYLILELPADNTAVDAFLMRCITQKKLGGIVCLTQDGSLTKSSSLFPAQKPVQLRLPRLRYQQDATFP